MSGGSFNYLYSRDLGEYSIGEVRAMAQALRDMGHEAAAKRTEDVADALALADAIRVELEDVWHDVEWVRSGDYARGDEAESVAAWAAKRLASGA